MFVFFGHMPIQILCSFLIGLFVCFHHEFTSSLYISYINQLLDTLFANIFFHLVANFSFCWGVHFLWRSFLVSCSPICLFLLLFPLSGETSPKKYYEDWCQRKSCMLFFKVELSWFQILHLSLIHFEFVFCAWCERISQFDSFACICQVFPKPFLEEAVFSPHFCHKLIAHVSVSLFLSSLFYPIDLCIYFWFSIILFWGPQLHLLLLLFRCHVMSNSFVTSWTVACQAHLSMGFPRQEYWSRLLFPSPNPGIKPHFLHCRQILLPLSHWDIPVV